MAGVFETAALTAKIPLALLLGICSAESDFRDVVNVHDGGSPSIGVCQVKLETARLMGFEGTAEDLRADRAKNVLIAARYLRYQLDRYKGDICAAISAYNMGTAKKFSDGRYKNQTYLKRVLKRMKLYSGGKRLLTKEQAESCDGGTQGWVSKVLMN